jgi:hypothetical protein
MNSLGEKERTIYLRGQACQPRWFGRVTSQPNPSVYLKPLTAGSIVAVHGLGGHAYDTWSDKNQKIWLRDFLPSQVSNARIMSYGYDSIVAFSKGVGEVEDFATDLLVRLNDERGGSEASLNYIFHFCKC